MKIRIGTRGSKLALWQACHVQKLLKENGAESEIIIIETKGDKILDRSLHKIGSKGLFTEELEDQLSKGIIDIAVHSAKDVQSSLPEGLSIIAFSARELQHDVLIASSPISIDQLDTLTIGTSSTRRRALIKNLYPDVNLVESRGNLQTRIAKLQNGEADALILAYAGVHRMGYDELIVHHFDKTIFIPPVGQGCLAIEASVSLEKSKLELIRAAINDPTTETCMIAERKFLHTLGGGCSIPSFAISTPKDNDTFTMRAGIISLNGLKKVTKEINFTKIDAETAGAIIGMEVLDDGGKEILNEIRNNLAS